MWARPERERPERKRPERKRLERERQEREDRNKECPFRRLFLTSYKPTTLHLYIYISSHGLTTATVCSWVHLILSSNLSRKFRILLQDLFSWHPVTTTQHLSWKNCTGFPFQNVLSIKSHACVSVRTISVSAYLSELLHVYTTSHTLRSSSDTCMLEIQQNKCKTHGFCTFSCFGPHIWNSLPQDLRHCSTLSSFKAKLKTFLFSQYFHPN